jgi:hypothetical protein
MLYDLHVKIQFYNLYIITTYEIPSAILNVSTSDDDIHWLMAVRIHDLMQPDLPARRPRANGDISKVMQEDMAL